MTTKEAVKAAAMRSLRPHFAVGRFDPVGDSKTNPWAHITSDVINSTEHQQVAHEAALQSFVLLKNNGLLPLKTGTKIAVVGPQALALNGLNSDYANIKSPTETSIADAMRLLNAGGTTTSAFGVDVMVPKDSTNTTACSHYDPDSLSASTSHGSKCIQQALQLVDDADVIVLVLGIDSTVEREKNGPNRHRTSWASRAIRALGPGQGETSRADHGWTWCSRHRQPYFWA